jgi:acetyltransferase-like isoleucine patch superfamily enzyme
MYRITEASPSTVRRILAYLFEKLIKNYELCNCYMYKRLAKNWGEVNYIDRELWLQHPGVFSLGHGTSIGQGFKLYGSGPLSIGDRCQISSCCTIITSVYNHTKLGPISREGEKPLPVIIGDDCWIGHAVTILPGVKIGNRSIIGACVVLTESVPDDSILTTRLTYRTTNRRYEQEI